VLSHTADGILSTETGLYPDEFGGGVANTYPYLNPKAKSGTSTTSLFRYWTDPTSSTDSLFTLIHGAASSGNPEGINIQAPWASFTRAGCDFAGVGSADMEFENDTTDVSNVFGANSPQFAFGNWSFNTAFDQSFGAGSDIGTTDFEGLAIHCSLADSAPGGKCSTANGGATDALPSEPGGYTGYNALFGALNVDPVRRVLQPARPGRDQQAEHAVPGHGRRGRPLRRQRAAEPRMQWRHGRVRVRHHRGRRRGVRHSGLHPERRRGRHEPAESVEEPGQQHHVLRV
jgi:hypothetical protein